MEAGKFNPKKYAKKIVKQLKAERRSFEPKWREIGEYIDPFRIQFEVEDHNKGNRSPSKIIDSTASHCSEILSAGLMSGITSPARPWFKLTTEDGDLAKYGKVKEWLTEVELIMTASHLRSNLYATLPYVYKDAGNFATAPFFVQEMKNGHVLHTTSFEVGSYMIGEDAWGKINTFAREFRMTVQQLVDMFGEYKNGKPDWSNFSKNVKESYERGNTEKWIKVSHIIFPNREFSRVRLESKFKRFRSIYFETDSSNEESALLRDSGYDLFPVLALRWGGKSGDVYGTSSPAILSLPDIKQLQHVERNTIEALDKSARPPMKASLGLKQSGANLLPNGITWIDDFSAQAQVFEPAVRINYPFNEVEKKQQDVRTRIENAYSKNLFLMLANDHRSGVTAREIDARYEEKLVMLGPVLQQFNSDGLDPFIDLSFDYHLRQGMLPPVPEELQGKQLKIEYVSVIAQAQKAIGINSDDRFLNSFMSASGIDESVRDVVNLDEYIYEYGDKLSVGAKILRTREEVEQIRIDRAQAQQAAAQAEAMMNQAKAAQTLANSPMGQGSVLDQLAEADSEV